ncbi:hypothetical protein LTR62_004931 [Meristemomyces frigidus]|uniref:Rhamnogalacturonase A/B/Epimerase-like pectate lyase domain-containing protein n=1 Tax=Meristemomyces frigidus TaxID=1508187 RepID=A0AAN7TEQ7_9PEZI|nr:hypothetical protein LTR62_004931 [Meristemomyces frigidus]
MFGFTALGALVALTATVCARPTTQLQTLDTSLSARQSGGYSQSSGYWLGQSSFHRNAPVWGNSNSNYPVFRSVTDPRFGGGAKGDGKTDDTDAINFAINSTLGGGERCGVGCNSSTISPALVYFPAGKYLVSSPILMDYYTQLVGDPTNPPTIIAAPGFQGMAVLDSDPYGNYGVNWFINQNNFFRQARNFIIDITQWNGGATGAGIHWQVAQATSLQNIVFEMSTSASTQQTGIVMDNGSGGFMGDLVFNGGKYGAFFGNQQFTSRNLTFNGCQTGIFMNWNWGWTLSGMTFNNCGTGLDMSNSPTNQTVGSVVLADSTFTGTQYGVKSAFSKSGNVPQTGGTLVIDNVDFGSATAVVGPTNSVIAQSIASGTAWASGNVYDHTGTAAVTQGGIKSPIKQASLLSNGKIFARSKPQYETEPASAFSSALAYGCKGDATTDDTQCVQNFLNDAASKNLIAYFDHAVYLVSNTIVVPSTIRVVGEVWATILASGFTDANNPKPVWQIGSSSAPTGAVEISDMLFAIKGPNPGAIMMQWELQSDAGQSGVWDTHIRIGGSYGSNLLLAQCAAQLQNPSVDANCLGAFLLFYATSASSGVYLENTWFWTADHDMEDPANRQISVYNARGTLIRSSGPVWLWGTSSEHSVFYNYQFDGASAVFAGFIQSETPYFQPYPLAPAPFTPNSNYDDPTFTVCNGNNADSLSSPCKDAWGLRVVNSQGVLIYSTGFYSFFNGYSQTCLPGEDCQENMIHIQNSQVAMYAVTTKASVNMILDDNAGVTITGAANADVYGDTIAVYYSSS